MKNCWQTVIHKFYVHTVLALLLPSSVQWAVVTEWWRGQCSVWRQTVRKAIGVPKTPCQRLERSAEIQAVSTARNLMLFEQRSRLAGLHTGQLNASVRYGLTWSGHLRDLASGEIFMIRGKHQRFTAQCIYFPTVGWDFKESVAFRFLWFDAAICHTWLSSWNFCVHACTCVCTQPECLSRVKSLHNTLLLLYTTVYLLTSTFFMSPRPFAL